VIAVESGVHTGIGAGVYQNRKVMIGKHSLKAWVMALPALVVLAQGCTKEQAEPITPPVEFALDYPAIPFTIQASQVPGQFQMQFELGSDLLGQALAAHDRTLGQMMEFSFTSAKLHLTSPADGNYNALESVAIEAASGDGTPITIANMYPVPDNSHTLILNLAGANVVELMRGGNVHINAKVHLDGTLPDVSNHQLLLSAKVKMQL
jgi:hypothetical protein